MFVSFHEERLTAARRLLRNLKLQVKYKEEDVRSYLLDLLSTEAAGDLI